MVKVLMAVCIPIFINILKKGNHRDNRLVEQENVFSTRDEFVSTTERKQDIPYGK